MPTLTKYRYETIARLGGKCLLCSETRAIQRAHIIPVGIFERVEGLEELASYDGDNIMPLCPTHHWCYDKGLLTADEGNILHVHIAPKLKALIEAAASIRTEPSDLPRAIMDVKSRKDKCLLWLRTRFPKYQKRLQNN